MDGDSEVVGSQKVAKYRIALRNKRAKNDFLTSNKTSEMDRQQRASPFQRNSTTRRSLPGIARTDRFRDEEEDETEFERRDLSIPGTPVSSRHVMSPKYRNQLAEKDKREKEKDFEDNLEEDDPLKKFIDSMRKLTGVKKSNPESNGVEPVKVADSSKPITPPSPLPRSKFGYNQMGSWNGGSNLKGYTPLFQRTMSVKLTSQKFEPANQHSKSESSDLTNGSLSNGRHSWDRPNLPKPPSSIVLLPSTNGEVTRTNDIPELPVKRPPLVRRSVSNVEKFFQIRDRFEQIK